MNKYSGHDLLRLGCTQGKQIGQVLTIVNASKHTEAEVMAVIERTMPEPKIPLMSEPAPCVYNITTSNSQEQDNVDRVKASMDIVLRTPNAVKGVVMPDACPAGPVGTIPVGGVVGMRGVICPGMHSADICCSLMATVINQAEPKDVLDAGSKVTHFGPGGRDDFSDITWLENAIKENQFTSAALDKAKHHMGTQGDGNHFLYVGRLESTGQTVLVTHHGSRGFGASVYKAGMRVAEKFRKKHSPETPKFNAWIPFDSADGLEYWDALQVVRRWTKANHRVLHNAIVDECKGKIAGRFWNEHNFVFRESDGEDNIFWHAKGATPIHRDFLPGSNWFQIVPLNMAEPILFVRGERDDNNLGFAPHGAGRNISRTQHKRFHDGRTDEELFAEETKGLDARFHCGRIDISELPSAYKNAESVQQDMQKFGLAGVVDRVLPYGSIMAGDWESDAPWKKTSQKTM